MLEGLLSLDPGYFTPLFLRSDLRGRRAAPCPRPVKPARPSKGVFCGEARKAHVSSSSRSHFQSYDKPGPGVRFGHFANRYPVYTGWLALRCVIVSAQVFSSRPATPLHDQPLQHFTMLRGKPLTSITLGPALTSALRHRHIRLRRSDPCIVADSRTDSYG
jgi:hypothetical protein